MSRLVNTSSGRRSSHSTSPKPKAAPSFTLHARRSTSAARKPALPTKLSPSLVHTATPIRAFWSPMSSTLARLTSSPARPSRTSSQPLTCRARAARTMATNLPSPVAINPRPPTQLPRRPRVTALRAAAPAAGLAPTTHLLLPPRSANS